MAALWLTGPVAAEPPRRLPPVDQAASDPSFVRFRAALIAAVDRKDAAFIERVLAPDIKVSFGGESGAADFRAAWRPEQPDSKLWSTLGAILRLGGSFEPGGSFVAPYTFSHFPDDLDPFESLVVIGSGVALRAEPKPDGALLARLGFEIVRPGQPDGPEAAGAGAWTKVIAANGHLGYVAAHLVRSPLDYRAGFARRDGEWRLVFLVAGD